jgi:cytochrome c biogenesis protein CcmG, thiol:disulfide interchange protein DsbE
MIQDTRYMMEQDGEITRRGFLGRCLGTAGAVVLSAGLGPGVSWGATGDGKLKTGERFSSFTLSDLQGKKLTVPKDFAGKVLVVHFWASYCNCTEEMKAIESMYKKYGEQGFVGVAVNVGQGRKVAESFATSLKLSYPVLLDDELKVAKRYGILSIPRTFIIDRKGVLKHKIIGEDDGEGLKKLVVQLL